MTKKLVARLKLDGLDFEISHCTEANPNDSCIVIETDEAPCSEEMHLHPLNARLLIAALKVAIAEAEERMH